MTKTHSSRPRVDAFSSNDPTSLRHRLSIHLAISRTTDTSGMLRLMSWRCSRSDARALSGKRERR
jgi:hypothetical protein